MIAWVIHTTLVALAGMAGFYWGSREVATSGIPPHEAENHRRQRKMVWRAMLTIRSLASLVLSIGFGIGGAKFTNTWITFAFMYGDPMLAAGAAALIAGQVALMFSAGRMIAIGQFGKWSFRWPSA